VHQAVQVLRAGDAPVAVAAGTNLILGPEQFIAESKLQMLSPDGRSRMWDADANGYARGEGTAAVILKPLKAALRDGDHIESIIVETGVNQDGATTGITMPSATAQAELIRETYRKAGLDPSRPENICQYFEAHGRCHFLCCYYFKSVLTSIRYWNTGR
jgi:hybrid polyketide synthase/nonribosomal peptide synthetase ACE1